MPAGGSGGLPQIAGRTVLLFWNSRLQQSQADTLPHALRPERGAGALPMLRRLLSWPQREPLVRVRSLAGLWGRRRITMAAGNVGSNRNHSTELPGMGYLVLKLDTCLLLFHLLLPNPGHARVLWRDDYLSSPLCQVTERHGST